jgi:ferredoxin
MQSVLSVIQNSLEHRECILCGTCVNGSAFNVIRFSFGKAESRSTEAIHGR